MSLKGHLRAPEKRPVGTGVSDGLAWTMFRPFQWAGRDFQNFFWFRSRQLDEAAKPSPGRRTTAVSVRICAADLV